MAGAPRTVALDWSGARADGGARGTWTAEVAGGRLVALANGRTRDEAIDHVIALAAGCPSLVVGLDFSFSLPAWFLAERGIGEVGELWELVAREGERWLADCPPPFFGAAGTRRPAADRMFRATELALAEAGWHPKSTFQIAGSGQVGPGSLRGMPLLARLRDAGFAVWPFDGPCDGRPMAVEVYPRLLTGRVNKRDRAARAAAVAPLAARMDSGLATLAEGGEDGFDAALSALAMDDRRDELRRLGRVEGAGGEGWIWPPVRDASRPDASVP